VSHVEGRFTDYLSTKTERSRQTSPSRKNQSPSGHVGEDLPVDEDDGVVVPLSDLIAVSRAWDARTRGFAAQSHPNRDLTHGLW
jgi:hypothetical protein